MMDLITQIKLVLFSFLFGIFFAFMLDVNCKYINSKRKIYRTIFTIFFMFFHVLLYFWILQKINSGILHYYSFLCILLGVLAQNFVVKALKK